MMGHELHRSRSFWSFLLSIAKELADSARQRGCSCGGRLHCANYPRAPRGGPDHLPEEYRCRFSHPQRMRRHRFRWLQSKEHTMMRHELHRSGRFCSFLLSIEKDVADSARQ